ncbi:sigma factor-binding protein Crl [Aeromonas schubertii]|uniref:Sigma factor-binding protein Crl n=2 Tax=Aeromonas TaxID=642 RepID=A0A0S2SLV9_9GAMM|nr:sigma factor-binding protein Crl [Aeromonas schubertii]ALP42713.1 DNA-binding transcriptional regulator Crl [Aeromonas schubertii]KUE79458.1 sigma factor-binding protein Crl [Aeromonas schubertii]MBZ6066734.1 sigma factor-binding protein Crl [Aeromonas schubertii]MBZ6072223.1 sigma factor-binding protein Crl [Aeromonas schubertii]QCG49133.1 sigma factor-binding protein Crl [Aeromonas schubertii]
MSEGVSYKRLLRKFLAIGPYLREEQCREGCYRFDCLSVCVSAKPAPDRREFWGWWLTLEQEERAFTYHYQFGFYDVEGVWQEKALPKKHQDEVERTLNQFYERLSALLGDLECQLIPAEHLAQERVITAA